MEPRADAALWTDLYALIDDRSADYDTYYDFYDGVQALPIDSSEFKSRFGTFFSSFRDNLARPIIESAESRVRFNEFGDGQGLGADALRVWRRSKMKSEAKRVHTEAMVKGDAYVIVLPREDGKAGIYPQISGSMAVLWDDIDPRKKKAAVKWWAEEMLPPQGSTVPQSYIRVNIYFPDRIERYVSRQQSGTLIDSWDKYRLYEDEGASITRHKAGQVPVFQFSANYDLTRQRGRSDLADAVPLIDAINKTVLDMMTASEFTAAPQRWATGVEIPLDPKTGEPVQSYTAGADKLWTAPAENARFGQFAAGDLKAYKDAVGVLVDHLAFITRTPVYALMRETNYPAGEALKSAEGPLRTRVGDHQADFGEVWAEVLACALNIDKIKVDEDDLIELMPRWLPVNAPFATREFLEELKVKAETLGVPEEMLWREAGYTADEIEEMKAMREEQAQVGFDAAAAVQSEAILGGAGDLPDDGAGGVVPDILPTDAASPLASP